MRSRPSVIRTIQRLILALVLYAGHAVAQVPQIISYQGLVTAAGNTYNGTGQFKFALVNSAGTLSHWSNDGTSVAGNAPVTAVSLFLTNGLFNVLLGDTSIPHMTLPIPVQVFTNSDVRLRIWFSPTGSTFQQLAPDQRLASVGFALQAANASIAQFAVSVAPGALTNVGTVLQVNTGAGLVGGPITNTGTISIPNNAINNAMLQNATVGLTAGNGLAGGGTVPLGSSTTLSANIAHDSTLSGNGADRPLALNLTNANTWTATQTFQQTIVGDVSGTALGFRGTLTGDVTGPQGATVISNLLKWRFVVGASQQTVPNTGYIVTNSAQVTLTLPINMNVGDTIRLSAPGTGGWKLAQNVGQSILAGNFGTLDIGLNWVPVGPTANWTAIASSADAAKLAAVVNNGQIYISTDTGTTWNNRENNRTWNDIAISSDGTKIVAVANGASITGAQIYTSADLGATWTARDTNRAWYGVASSADGTKLVAVVNSGYIYTSADSGSTWIVHSNLQPWHAVASSADGTRLAAVAYGGQVATSRDSGATWSPMHGPSGYWESVACSADGTKLAVAGRNSALQISTDSGVTWTPRDVSRVWVSIAMAADGTRMGAVVSGGQIYVSLDSGTTWNPRESNRAWTSIASSADGTRFAAAVANGQVYISIPPPITAGTTTALGTAGYLLGGQGTALELQYIGNNQFLPLTHEGQIWAF